MHITGMIAGEVKYPRAIHIYRLTMPLDYIRKNTRHTAWWVDAQTLLNAEKSKVEEITKSDIIVLGRPIAKDYRAAYNYIELLRSKGAKIVYETDDDLTETYRDISGEAGATCLPYLPSVDALTVTTEALKTHLAQYTEKPIYVVNNYIDHKMFRKVLTGYKRKNTGTTNIMLVGTATHGSDWELAYMAISKILKERSDVKLLVGGFHPNYIPNAEQVEFLPWVSYVRYPTLLAEADIVVAAIDPEDKFNHSKSAVKAMEAWAAVRKIGNTIGGAAVVATDSVVYNGVVKHMKNGIIAQHDVDAYYNGIKLLLDDLFLRKEIQRRGYLDGIKNHSIMPGYRKWVSAYTNILRS